MRHATSNETRGTQPSGRLDARFLTWCVVALGAFIAAYANSLHNVFQFDDQHVVVQNPYIRDLSHVGRYFVDASTFSSLPQNAVYRPLVSLTLAVDYALAGGLDPFVYHITQLVLFASVGLGVFLVARDWYARGDDSIDARWPALAAATLFVVHTANSQVGNYISARSELLAALGVLGGFVVYARSATARRWHLYLLPVALGLLAKNHAVVFAPLLFLYKLLIEAQLAPADLRKAAGKSQLRGALWSSVPAFVALGALLVFVEAMPADTQHHGGGGRVAYLITSMWVWVRYLSLYVAPVGLTADTDLELFTAVGWRSLVGLGALGVSVVVAWRAAGSRAGRPIAFGLAWFWLSIAPTSSVMPLAEVTNDHRAFLGYIGLNAAAVLALWRAALWFGARTARRVAAMRVLACFVVVVIVAHVMATRTRNRVWRTEETLWADVVAKSPRNARGLMNYGLERMEVGDYAAAKEHFLRARDLRPNYSFVETNLGIVESVLGDTAAANAHHVRALELEPTQPGAFYFYGRFLIGARRAPAGADALRRAIALSPSRLDARLLLMALLAARGDSVGSVALANETLRLVPDDGIVRLYALGATPLVPASNDYAGWWALGLSETGRGRHLEAALAYRGALRHDPRSADAWNNLGWSLANLGFYGESVVPFERAIALRPSYALARNNLVWVQGVMRASPR